MINHKRRRNGSVLYWTIGTGTWNTSTANFKSNRATGTSIAYLNSATSPRTVRIASTANGTLTLSQPTYVSKICNDVTSGTTAISGNATNKLNFIGGSPVIDVASGGSLTIGSDITADGPLKKTSPGKFTMNGTRTDSNGTILQGGTYALFSVGGIGTSGIISMEGGILQYTSALVPDLSSRFNHSSPNQSYNIDTNGQNASFSTPLSSTNSSVLKNGTGTLFINQGGTFTNVNVNAGTAQLGNGSSYNYNLPSATIASGAGLTINTSSDHSLDASSRLIQGAGSLTKLGNGKLTMIGPHTYSGGTNVHSGVLELQGTNPIGSSGAINFNAGFYTGTLKYTSANTTDYSSRISALSSSQYRIDTNGQNITFATGLSNSTCTFAKRGLGNLIMSGANTFSSTLIGAGNLQIGAGGATGTITSPISLGYDSINAVTSPMNCVASPDQSKLYVTSYSASNAGIYVIDAVNNSVLANIAATGGLVGIAINSTGTRLFVTKYGNSSSDNAGNIVYVIDTSTNSIIQTVTVGGAPHACVVSPDDRFLYVTCETSKAIYRIDLSTYLPTSVATLNVSCFSITMSVDGTKLYVGTGTTVVPYIVDISTGNLTAGTALTGFSNAYNMARTSSTVYVSNYGNGTVTPIAISSDSIGSPITVGSGPYGMGMSSDGLTLCVGNFTGNTVSVIDTSTNTVANTLFNCSGPRNAVKIGSKIFVNNINIHTVYAVDTTKSVDLSFNRTGAVTASGAISGYGTLTKNGSGTLTLSGANSYSGNTIINSGAINVANATALGAETSTVSIPSGTALEISNNITLARNVSISGDGISSGGALRNTSGNNTISGSVSLLAASRINSDSGTLTLSGRITGTNRSITFGGAGNITHSNNISIGGGGVTKDGAGIVTLSGTNTIYGNTSINSGTLAISNSSSLGTYSSSTITIASGATLDMSSVPTGTTITRAGLSASGATIKFNVTTSDASKLLINGDVNLTGTNIVLNANSLPANGTIDLLTYTGTLTGTPTTATVTTGAGADFTGTVVNNTAQKKIQITVTALTSATSVAFELVGGGSGGSYNNTCATGGGGGYVLQSTASVSAGTQYSVVIGAGGAGAGTGGYAGGAAGSASTFAGQTAPGAPAALLNGATSANGWGPTSGYGYISTAGWTTPSVEPGTPSGGYQAWGGAGHNSEPIGAQGGYGVHHSSTYIKNTLGNKGLGYGGGGGCGGAGNNWGGGAGSKDGTSTGVGCYPPGIQAYAAPANSGCGGGGGAATANPARGGSNGGSGALTIRYSSAYKPATTTGSPTYVVTGGFRYYTFTGAGTIIF